MSARKQFTREFKREAVQLLASWSRPASELARELRVRRNQLYKWQREFQARGTGAFPGAGVRKERTMEIARLKRELARVTEKRNILKKAAGRFKRSMQHPLGYSGTLHLHPHEGCLSVIGRLGRHDGGNHTLTRR